MLGSGGGKLLHNESFREAIEPCTAFKCINIKARLQCSHFKPMMAASPTSERGLIFSHVGGEGKRGGSRMGAKCVQDSLSSSSCFVHRESVCQRPIKNGPRSERRTTEVGRRSVVEGNCRLVTCSNLVRQFVAVITPPTYAAIAMQYTLQRRATR